MSTNNIHPTAIIAEEAKLGENITVGPYSIIGPEVVIGNGTTVESHVVIEGETIIGENNYIFSFASIGKVPQDLKFKGEKTRTVIGNNNKIKTVALLGGSGADFIYTLPEVDAYLTGDIGYHAALDAMEMQKNIIDVGHFTEHLVKDLLLEYVGQLPIDVEKSKVEESPFKIL